MTEKLGPVSSALEAEVRDWLARNNLVIWLDTDQHYVGFVDELIRLRESGELKYDVFTFSGSHLEMMLALEDVASGTDTTRALIHLPGFNRDSIRSTPLLELYKAGTTKQRALPTLIKEAAAARVRPDQIDDFLHRDDLTLAAADVWLHDLLTTGTEGLASQIRNVSLTELVDDLLFKRFIAERVSTIDFSQTTDDAQVPQNDADRRAIRDRIVSLTGMPESWFDDSLTTTFSTGVDKTPAEGIAYAICSWAQCVSFVHDLTVPPKTEILQSIPGLPAKVRDECHSLVVHLQGGPDQQREFYRQAADETESRLVDDKDRITATELGRFDTFRFEEETILSAAIQAIHDGDWTAAAAWAEQRADAATYWLRDDPLRRNAWQLVSDAAQLGTAIEAAGSHLTSTDSLQSAVDEYTGAGVDVDRAHRLLEQDRQKLLRSQMPEFVALRTGLDRVLDVWQDWANAWAVDFNEVCTSQGFLPDPSHQQRMLFDQDVKPLTGAQGTTAYFVVDSLRYEMGRELFEAINGTAQTNVKLEWRLSELPSVTEVGMNVLAPVVKNGQLKPVLANGKITGFSTGQFKVSDPDSRKRAMHDRVGGRTCPKISLQDVLKLEAASLKRKVAGARLVMVHSREFDQAGEEGLGPLVFEDVIQHLKSAWHILREAGVQNFVFAGDHGFLLIDEERSQPIPHGTKRTPSRRHVISDIAADHPCEVRVPMRDLGYDCENAHVMFPASIAVFDRGRKRTGFAHGGNSLQERVIPVLTVSHRAPSGGSSMEFDLTAVKGEQVMGLHCMSAKVTSGRGSLDFGSSYEVDLALRVPDAEDVRAELCETRGGARLSSGAIVATVGEEVELFFRLTGDSRSRVQVELYHPSSEASVQSCVLRERFDVAYTPTSRTKSEEAEKQEPVEAAEAWLDALPEGGVRRVFQHLAQHGTITEQEVNDMLNGAREARKFARKFEKYAECVPFNARIDTVSGVKRYVREGAAS